MGKGCSRKRSKKRIAFDERAVVKNGKVKNAHAQYNVAGADVAEGAVCKGTAVKFFI